jgi:RNA polymerase sigma factor (sigma-70 family)
MPIPPPITLVSSDYGRSNDVATECDLIITLPTTSGQPPHDGGPAGDEDYDGAIKDRHAVPRAATGVHDAQRTQTESMNRRLPTDEVARLVAQAADGDQDAWNTLVDAFVGMLWATTRAHRLSAADAADVVQTTWMRLVENLDRIDDPTRVGAWLMTTARRECVVVLRRAGRQIPHGDDMPDPDPPCYEPHPDDRLISEQDALAVRAALQRLAPRDRALLRMLAAEPAASYEEIGAALGMAVGSIGPTRARSLARLRSELLALA